MQTFRSINEQPVEFRAGDDDKPTIITGYAAVFNSLSHDLGGFLERIMPGAFDRTLREIHEGKRQVAARIQHDGGLTTVGTTGNESLRLSVNKTGLKYEIVALPDTSAARDLVELVRGGYISKSSFAFSIPNFDGERWLWDKTPPIRELIDIDLHDVAPVDGPAYEATSVSARAGALDIARQSVVKRKQLSDYRAANRARYPK